MAAIIRFLNVIPNQRIRNRKMRKLLMSCCAYGLLLSSCSEKSEFIGFTYPEGKYKALVLSYDDGTVEDIELAKLFDQHNLVGTFNLNSEYLGTVRLLAR